MHANTLMQGRIQRGGKGAQAPPSPVNSMEIRGEEEGEEEERRERRRRKGGGRKKRRKQPPAGDFSLRHCLDACGLQAREANRCPACELHAREKTMSRREDYTVINHPLHWSV